MKKKLVARAPGKLILSGEYSALYKMPAIVFAIDKFTEATVSMSGEAYVVIELQDYDIAINLSYDSISERCLKTKARYNDFLLGSLPIENVLESPVDLCCFIISFFLNHENRAKYGNGKEDGKSIKISIKSDIPIESGFGSSAAFIVSLMKGLEALFCLDLGEENFYKFALEAENLVHGSASGIDVLTSMVGGCNYFDNNARTSGNDTHMPCFSIDVSVYEMFSVFTGRPQNSTGESIAKVKDLLNTSNKIEAFGEVTLNLKRAIENNDLLGVMSQIKKNNLLLTGLGIVPVKIQDFIKEIEQVGGAAKICGSGAITGENAGVMIALGDFVHISKIAEKYGYTIERVTPSTRGAYVV